MNGATSGIGGTGNWTTTGTTWTTNSAGTNATISGGWTNSAAWTNNNANNAVLQGTTGTVSLSIGTIFANQIQVNTTGFTIRNDSTGTTGSNRYFRTKNGIVLADGVNLNISSGITTNGAITGFEGPIVGANGTNSVSTGSSITITGSTLNADSSVRIALDTSSTDVWVPIIVNTTGSGYANISISSSSVTSSLYGNVTVNSGSRLVLGGNNSATTRRINVRGNLSTVNTDLTIGETGGGGVVVLYGNNSIGGNVVLRAGQLGFGTNTAFGNSTVVISDGTFFGQQGTIGGGTDAERTLANKISVQGNVTLGLGSFGTYLGGSLDLNGATRTLTLANSTYISGAVTNGGISLVSSSGSRILALNGNNTYAGGTTQNGGTISLGSDTGLGITGLTVNSNAVGNTLGATDGRNIANAITLATGASLNLDSSSTNSAGLPTSWTQSGSISGAGSITKTGVGTLTLAGALSYSGSTTVSAGTLVVVSNNLSASITSNSIAVTFSNSPANGTYGILPGALSGAFTASYSNLPADKKATLSTVSPASVTVASKTSQSISFGSLPVKSSADAPFTLSGSATSALPISYTSSNPNVATVSGNTVTIVGAGTTVITATQGGDETYAPANALAQTLQVLSSVYGVTNSQNFDNFTTADLLSGASGWSTGDTYVDSSGTYANGFRADSGGGLAASIGGWVTASPQYRMTYQFAPGNSDRLVITWKQRVESSTDPAYPAVDRFGWEFKSGTNVLFALKMVQFVDSNGNGTWDPADAATSTPAEPLAGDNASLQDKVGGSVGTNGVSLFVTNKVVVAGYSAAGARLTTADQPNFAVLDRDAWYEFRVIVDLREDRWWGQIKSGSNYVNLMNDTGAPLPAGASSLDQMVALWELNNTRRDTDFLYQDGGSNQMLFDDLSIAGSKIVQLSLATPSGAIYNGSTQGATVGDEGSGLAQVLYRGTNNGVVYSNSTAPANAGFYNVTVGVANPYFGVIGTNAARLYTDSTVLTQGYTIQRKEVTVSNVAVANKIYDRTTSATLTGTPALVGKVGSDDVSLAGAGSASFATADAGAVKLATISGYSLTGAAASNYQLTGLPISASAEISKKTLTVTAQAKTKAYGDSDPALTYSSSGLISGDSISGALARASGENVGSYAISQGTVTAGSNYDVNFTGANFTITAAAVPTVAFTPPADLTYDGTAKTHTASASGVSGFTYLYTGTNPVYSSSNAPVNAGSYRLVVTSADANYAGTATNNFTISKATAVLGGVPTATDITYGQTLANSTLTASALGVDGNPLSGSFAFTTPSTAPNAGTALQGITFTPTDTANYNSLTDAVQVIVLKATTSITSASASGITYGQALGDATLSGSASVPGTFAFADPTIRPMAGTADWGIVFTPNDSTNYEDVTGSAEVVVAKATLTVVAGPQTKSYGEPDPAFTYTATGFVNGDTESTVLSGLLGRDNLGEDAGQTYPITIGSLDAGSNYLIDFYSNDLQIIALDLTSSITLTPPVSLTYDGSPKDWAASSSFGLNSSEFEFQYYGRNTTNYGMSSTAPTDAGEYTVLVTVNNPNYTGGTVSEDFIIDPAPRKTISGVDLTKSKVFGDSPYSISATIDSPLSLTYSSDNPSVATVDSSGLVTIVGAGDANIIVSQSPDNNYVLALDVVQLLTVAKATPTITASPTASAIIAGQTLGDSALSGGSATGVGGAALSGSFAFTTPSTQPSAGTANQSVTFTPDDSANYETVTTTVSVTVNAATTPAQDYLAGFGLTGANAALSADPDGDGLSNAQEFAFGAVPNVAGSLPITTSNTGGSLKMVFLGRTTGVTYHVVTYTNLNSGTPSTNAPTVVNPQPSGLPTGYTQYEASVNSSTATRKFMKVDAVIP